MRPSQVEGCAVTIDTSACSSQWPQVATLGARSEHPASSSVIIFDWDDTLLCTTAIRNRQCCFAELEELAARVETVLRVAMELAETIIVTNGRDSWVEESAELYLPQLLPLLGQLRCVSARALYEHLHPDDPVMWKVEAFTQLLTKGREYDLDVGSLNLVALGDQPPELEAARTVGRLLGVDSAIVKTVKLFEFPSVSQLLGQLERLARDLGAIVGDQASGGRALVTRRGAGGVVDVTAQAIGWRCVPTEDKDAWGFNDPFGLQGLWQPCP